MTAFIEHRFVVTGGAGFLGRNVVRVLQERGVPRSQITIPRRASYDLTREADVERLYADAKPDIVLHLAAEVGGIGANMNAPGRFFFANMAMGLHLVEHARLNGIAKFVHTGTVCAYPKNCPVPFREEDIWNGFPEETNAPYGIAKKALFTMLVAYYRQYELKSAVVVPVNLYGPGDNFDKQSSHVIPALIRKCEEARVAGRDSIQCWGTGKATREFLFVEDAAEAIVRAAEVIDEPSPINLGGGREIAIGELVREIALACDFRGEIQWDASKPDGQPRRGIDISRARSLLKWAPQKDFTEGLAETVQWWRSSCTQ
ncbi:MAG: GDP-L-fucose synthase [Planctomycetaceae bacterium]|nr:MAG: GDP-L-fucose synthase [Planctomycetaceae bacterium]